MQGRGISIWHDLICYRKPVTIQVFYRPEGPKGGGDTMKKNFDIFQIQKWILQTVRAQKVDEKNVVICLVSFFLSWVMVLKLPKCIFCKFKLTSAQNLNLLKQFIYIHLIDLIMLFQKIVCLKGVCATIHEISRNKILKKVLNE